MENTVSALLPIALRLQSSNPNAERIKLRGIRVAVMDQLTKLPSDLSEQKQSAWLTLVGHQFDQPQKGRIGSRRASSTRIISCMVDAPIMSPPRRRRRGK